MTVKELIKLLKKEDPKAEVLAWLGADQGWKLVKIGIGDAIIGCNYGEDYPCPDKYVLLPIEVPETYEDWDDGPNAEEYN